VELGTDSPESHSCQRDRFILDPAEAEKILLGSSILNFDSELVEGRRTQYTETALTE